MKKLLLSTFTIAVFTAATAQKISAYPVVVSFNSMCCGVPNSNPLKQFINTFKKNHRITQITIDSIGPMGKEGEYYLAFKLKEFNNTQKLKFIQQLKKSGPLMDDRGSVEIKENVVVNKADLFSQGVYHNIKVVKSPFLVVNPCPILIATTSCLLYKLFHPPHGLCSRFSTTWIWGIT